MYNTNSTSYWEPACSDHEPINDEYIGCKIPVDFDGYIVITHRPDFLEEDEFKI